MATLVGNIRGPAGQPGPQGEKGDPGTSVVIKGQVPTSADLPTGLTPDDAGDGYITADTGHLWVWDGTAWIDAGPIVGPPGPAGEDGADGAPGAPGGPGPQGSRGTGWFTGAGAPVEPIAGSIAGDLYLDTVTGDVYTLAGA